MKKPQSQGDDPNHQTVAEKIKFQSAGQSIQIEFTDQRLSPHAGTATFWSFLHGSGWRGLVTKSMPHRQPTSNNGLLPITKVLSFVQGLLCGAKKLTHVAYLRRDPMMPALLGIKRVPSQSTLRVSFRASPVRGKPPRASARFSPGADKSVVRMNLIFPSTLPTITCQRKSPAPDFSENLEAFDGTPIVDMKATLEGVSE